MIGGIFNSGTLTLVNSVVSESFAGCTQTNYGCISVGGIYNTGTLALEDTDVTHNSTECLLSTCLAVGGIYNTGTLALSKAS